MANDFELYLTDRGFALAEFSDARGEPSSIQESSSAHETAIWLGTNNARMHLNRAMAGALLPMLQRFAATGRLGPIEPAQVVDLPGALSHLRTGLDGVYIAPYEIVIGSRDGTSHTVGVPSLESVHSVVDAQLTDPTEIRTLQIRKVVVGAEDLAGALQELLQACPDSPSAARAQEVLDEYEATFDA